MRRISLIMLLVLIVPGDAVAVSVLEFGARGHGDLFSNAATGNLVRGVSGEDSHTGLRVGDPESRGKEPE